MKTRKIIPTLLLLLVPSICGRVNAEDVSAVAAAADTPLSARDGPAAAGTPGVPRREVGTKYAPVDGRDGKPHEGPFVESGRDADSKKSSDAATVPSKEKPVAEDGVMNDPTRAPPKKGTTGTEGGVTEKEMERQSQESATGQIIPKKPTSPKVASPNPAAGGVSGLVDQVDSEKSKTSEGDKMVSAPVEKPKGAPGMEKPEGLPPTPHDKAANPDVPPKPAKNPYEFDPSKTHVFDKQKPPPLFDALESDRHDADDYDDEEGVHDLIPWDSLAGSFSSIAATEIGDKTFIVAALMAMRHPRIQVFTAAFSALFVMTILSGVMGHAVGTIMSKRWAALLAAILFLVFGVKSIREGLEMHPNQGVSEEMREVQAELEEKEVDMARMANGRKPSSISPYALESGRVARPRSRSRLAPPQRSPSSSRSPSPRPHSVSSVVHGLKNLLSLVLSPAWVETFSMTFVGELGDRSQIATVAMAAGQEYYWVMVGASLGHFVCTAFAVLGGSVLAGRVSMRKVTLTGGGIFIGFGIFTLLEAIQYWQS